MGPYRAIAGVETLLAPTRQGQLRLEVAPRHTLVAIEGVASVAFTDEFFTLTTHERRRAKRVSMRLGEARVAIARGVPSGEIALWYEDKPHSFQRVIGFDPVELLTTDALRAWHALDAVAKRLQEVISPHARGVKQALELGPGHDRVLVADFGDHFTVYVRKLFRGRQRRVLEVYDDGTVVVVSKGKERRVRCSSRFGVTVSGDHIRFSDATGFDLASLSLPWIGAEDRVELARRLGDMLTQSSAAR